MNCQQSQFLYTTTPVPRFNAQPYKVYSTPGLGNFFDDHNLYTPVRYYEPNIKEVEKQIDSEDVGGFELNSPLIIDLPPRKQIKRKSKMKSTSRKKKSIQKGHGSSNSDKTQNSPTDPEIDEALQHPIKVLCYCYNIFYSIFFVGIRNRL